MGHRALDEFTHAYIEAALFTESAESPPSGGQPLDKNYGESDITDESLAVIDAQCEKFQQLYGDVIDAATCRQGQYSNREMAGHDFWMTRNGHGVGFWDGDWSPQDLADQLDEGAKKFGEAHLDVGDDGAIHYEDPDYDRSLRAAATTTRYSSGGGGVRTHCGRCGAALQFAGAGGMRCPVHWYDYK